MNAFLISAEPDKPVLRVLRNSFEFDMTEPFSVSNGSDGQIQKMSVASTRIINEPLSPSLLGNEKETYVFNSRFHKPDGANF